MDAERTLGVRQFDGSEDSNFAAWKVRVKTLLDEKDLLNHIQPEVKNKPEDPSRETLPEWKKADKRAKSLITKCLGDAILTEMEELTTPLQMWEWLENRYQRKSVASRIFLKKKLVQMTCNENESLDDYFRKFDEVYRKFKNAGGAMEESDLVMQLMISLPDRFDNIVSALENLEPTELTMERVKARLLEEETKRKTKLVKTDQSTGAAFNSNRNTKKLPICYNCKEEGHKRPECPKRNKNKKKGAAQNAEKRRDEQHFGMISEITIEALNVTQNNGEILNFVVDSGCTDHMMSDEKSLMDVQLLKSPFQVSIADKDTTMVVKKAGKLPITSIIDGKECTGSLNEVLVVPSLRHNLLSVSKIESNGGTVLFKKGEAKIWINGRLVAKANRVGNLYVTSFKRRIGTACVSQAKKEVNDLWHRRLGHLSMDGICKLKGMAEGIPDKLSRDIDFCECCKRSKMTKLPFADERTRARRPLQRIHSDVCGPLDATHDGYKYFVSFVDDYTHMAVIYLMRKKSEVIIRLKEFVAMAEAHFGTKVERLRSDNGGEYSSIALKQYCTDRGIILEPTTPYTPELNGVAERLNRTLMEKTRSLLNEAELPKSLWGEATFTAVYLTNRSPTSAVKDKTPYELWFGEKPNLSKLKVFGSPCIIHVPKEKRGKLDPTGVSAIFVGYGFNGYRCWIPDQWKVVNSRDVVVNESKKIIVSEVDLGDEVEEPTLPVGSDIGSVTKDSETFSSDNESSEETLTPSKVINSTPHSKGATDDGDSLYESATESPNNEPTRQQPKRNCGPPLKLEDYEMYYCSAMSAAAWIDDIPLRYEDISGRDDEAEWRTAVKEELNSIEKNETWTLVKPVKGKKLIGAKWVFAMKPTDDGKRSKCKARLVAKGFMQREGIDYSETYAPVARLPTVRMLLSIGIQMGMIIEHLDVKTAFLHGNLEEEVYLKPPPGVTVPDDHVLKLKKSLYGLKQSNRCWNHRFHSFMLKLDFNRSDTDSCLYYKRSDRTLTFVVLYVDDLLICCSDAKELEDLKLRLASEFSMKDLGPVKLFMGLEIERSDDKLIISQQKFIEKVLCKFGMSDCNPIATPMEVGLKLERAEENKRTKHPYRELLGSLMYIMIGSRPDICYALTYLSRFQDCASDVHWAHLKRLLRYLKGTTKLCLQYQINKAPTILTYVDSDWANDIEERKSTTGFIIKVYENTVIWASKKQKIVTLSSTEAEYVAACTAACETVWVINTLASLKIDVNRPVTMYEDNLACIMISKNPETRRTKHFDTKYHFLRELVSGKEIKLESISTKDQLADTLTKALPFEPFQKFRIRMGIEVRGGVETNNSQEIRCEAKR